MSASSHATTFAPPVAADGRMGLIGLDRSQLESVLAELGLPAFRARQVWHWLYHRGVTTSAWPWNGLNLLENRELFACPVAYRKSDVDRAVELIVNGLSRVDWKTQARQPA